MTIRLVRHILPTFLLGLLILAYGTAPRAQQSVQQPAKIVRVQAPPIPVVRIVASPLPAQLAVPRVDVTAYGARAVAGYDNAPAFQAAHDALAATLQGQPGSLYIPPAMAPYDVASPTFLDAPNITVYSDGSGASLRSGMLSSPYVSTVNCPIFVAGYRRSKTIGGAYAANFATYRPDLFGKLDGSIANGPGQRWGFRTNTNAFVYSHGTPLSHGGTSPALGWPYPDMWAETKSVTIEFAYESFGGPLPVGTTLFAMSDQQAGTNNFPFKCGVGGDGRLGLAFCTQAARFGPVQAYSFAVPQAPGGGVQRVAFQIDLTAPVATAWLNGVQQSTDSLGMVAGARFRENEDFPFCFGCTGDTAGWQGTFPDFAVYGFSMSKTLRYKVGANGGVQSLQAPTANRSTYSQIQDSYRYADDGTDRGDDGKTSGLIGRFVFSEPPSLMSPMLSVPGSGGGAYPAWIGCNQQLQMGGIPGHSFKNLRFEAVRPFGSAVYLAQVLDTKLIDCDFKGGFWPLANLPMGANYTLIANRCTFDTFGGSAFYLSSCMARFRDCEIKNGGRYTMEARASNLIVDAMFVARVGGNCATSVLRYHGGNGFGGNVSLRDISVDIEDAPYPARAAFWLERSPQGTFFRFHDIDAGRAPGMPLIFLDQTIAGQLWPANTVITDNCHAAFASGYSQSNGPGWTGQFTNTGMMGPGAVLTP